jgi:hypothetical protein
MLLLFCPIRAIPEVAVIQLVAEHGDDPVLGFAFGFADGVHRGMGRSCHIDGGRSVWAIGFIAITIGLETC